MIGAPSSRAATDALLRSLRDGGWRRDAWSRFLRDAARRSLHQAARRPRALAEVTALHAVLATAAGPGRRTWSTVSWALAITHLGMLEHRDSIGWPGVLTLTRANLPALGRHRWLPLLALGTDVVDGRLARALGSVTPFGTAADSLADAAFWTWHTTRHEPSRTIRAAALLAWALPVVTVTARSFRLGRMVDAPRPVLLRPAALLQAVLTVRALAHGVRVTEPGAGAAVSGPASA